MPAGQTHDRITLWSLPLIVAAAFERTRSGTLTLLVAGGFLFSGLMFGPDLDLHSRQYRRWGFLRWVWLPYRKMLRHRSWWSHGPIVGTVGRVVYLLAWVSGIGLAAVLLFGLLLQIAGQGEEGWRLVEQSLRGSGSGVRQSLQQYPFEWLALAIGLELGALSHSLSDWTGSYFKSLRQRLKRAREKEF